MNKKIIFVTTNRADFGILKNILKKFDKSDEFNTTLIVSGSHFLKKYGKTIREINEQNFKRIKIFKMITLNNINEKNFGSTFSKSFNKSFNYFKKFKPDLIFLVGDRIEILPIANASLLLNIPLAHLHGGELTLGAIDDVVRHSISKIARIHFVSTLDYKNRLVQLGEDPKKIFVTGSPSIENISKKKILSKSSLENKIKINLNFDYIVCTVHPETRNKNKITNKLLNLFKAFNHFRDLKIIFTMPNFDEGALNIQKKIIEKIDNKKYFFFPSLGHDAYLSLINFSKGSVGNSSSNIIELPSLKKGAINIGSRQKGRVMAKNIINCEININSIKKSIKKLLSKSFNDDIKYLKNPYYKKNSSNLIYKHLRKNLYLEEKKYFNQLIHSKKNKFKLIKI